MTTMLHGKGGRKSLCMNKETNFTSEQIIYDNLKTEHPSWPYTSFGAPHFRSLISADLSFEEYHLAALEANRNGTFPQWVSSSLFTGTNGQQQEMDQSLPNVENQEENVLRNV